MKDSSILKLKQRLTQNLPGHLSHAKVMEHRKPVNGIDFQKRLPRKSAVLLHLYMHSGQLHLSYIERPEYQGVHSRQISFPGGKAELEDVSLMQTAIREAQEEVNIKLENLEVIGMLSEIYIPPSNFLVQPYVSFQKKRPNFIPDPREVSQIIELPVKDLLNQKLAEHQISAGKQQLRVNGYELKGKVMWGATAMITTEFLDVFRELDL